MTAFQGSFADSFNDNNCLSSGQGLLLLQQHGLGKVKPSYGFILLLIDTVMCDEPLEQFEMLQQQQQTQNRNVPMLQQ